MRLNTVKRLSRFHSLTYRLSGGRIGARLANNDMLLLTTVGRRTSEPHTVPLLYLSDGGRLIVIASYGGRPQHPEWYLNLLDEPRTRVRIGRETRHTLARTMDHRERNEWWPRIVDAYGDYALYQSRTDREIPIVWLAPVPEAP